MAFDVSKLFSPQAFNMLLQPGVLPPDTRNMLLSREIPNDPSANPPMAVGMPPQQAPQPQPAQIPVPMQDPRLAAAPQPQMASQQMMPALGQDSPRIYNPQMVAGNGQPQGTDPMTTASIGQQGQPAGQPGGMLGGLRSFIDGDRGQYFHDMFTGWATGANPGESLGNGAKLAGANYTTNRQTNQTVDWLKSKGMADDQAHLLAGNPTALGDYLKQLYSPKASGTFQTLPNGDYGTFVDGRFVKQGNAAKPPGADGPAKLGLQPVYGTDTKTGKTGIGQLGEDGLFHVVDTGGFQPVGNVSNTNLGTSVVTKDKAGNVLSSAPVDNAGKSSDSAFGTLQGDARARYASMSSKMPGLVAVISKLDDLSDKATYTGSGQMLDIARKQLGMEPRDAAVARTDYISTVDNQVLPLLRDTFGAAFTEREGDSLRATLGDPNKTPTEKKTVLHSFIEQKQRDLQALAAQSGATDPAVGSPAHIDDLLKKYGGQ